MTKNQYEATATPNQRNAKSEIQIGGFHIFYQRRGKDFKGITGIICGHKTFMLYGLHISSFIKLARDRNTVGIYQYIDDNKNLRTLDSDKPE